MLAQMAPTKMPMASVTKAGCRNTRLSIASEATVAVACLRKSLTARAVTPQMNVRQMSA